MPPAAKHVLNHFSADLYGGHTEGLLIVNNNQPVQYVMKQKAEGDTSPPDAARFVPQWSHFG